MVEEVKRRSSLRSASDGKYVVPGTHLVFGHWSFTVAGPSIWNSLPPMSPIPSLRLAFALNWRVASSALPMDSNDFPASLCTSELCKEGQIKLQLYCMVLYCISTTETSSELPSAVNLSGSKTAYHIPSEGQCKKDAGWGANHLESATSKPNSSRWGSGRHHMAHTCCLQTPTWATHIMLLYCKSKGSRRYCKNYHGSLLGKSLQVLIMWREECLLQLYGTEQKPVTLETLMDFHITVLAQSTLGGVLLTLTLVWPLTP